ncbi:AraC family transcriptional regulator [Sandaracinus amylolyticus]|uniref:Transcriptional regulator, AraC family protein n=1 Tax=Sandaracinus amylolyticus TaxID=927083 RepID=A0A0F6W6S7_9BACT|nr:AraC family transcriptional regulator [Sandaracinus amylolyticus]AKF08956.1 Transcriptional regulator, AraC family protein [Sandaracinus amylolyticus]
MNRADASIDGGAIRVSSFVLTWPRLLGLSLEEVARASDIPLAQLESGAELSYEETLALWRALEALTDDPVVGLHAGARFTLDQMGVVGPALAHCTHLDAAIDALVRIMKIFVRNAHIARVDTDDGAGIEYRMPTLRTRQGADTIFAATTALVRHCTATHVVPIALEHQMPRCGEAEYERFFGVRPRWDRPTSYLLFARADLALPFRGAAPELAALLSEHAPRLLTKSESVSFDQELERAFWAAHARGEASLETTAAALGVGARTLQRRLTSMGSSFAQRRSEILHRRAVQLLRDEQIPIDVIAERLGYSSRTAFERAFTRWCGKTPHAVRLESR